MWTLLNESVAASGATATSEPWIQPDRFRLVALNPDILRGTLTRAPKEGTVALADAGLEISLPMPDGTFSRFRIAESPVMAPALSAKFPQIKTYIGQGLDDPSATLRMDRTPAGFHAQVLSPHGAFYIDPFWKGNATLYATYLKRDYRRGGKSFSCQTRPGAPKRAGATAAVAGSPSGNDLRTYRLACAATGEYTQFHGGTVAAGLAAIVTAVNRVTGIYEVELAVRMELVANNDLLVYTNPATDPYSNGDGFSMLDQNQSNIPAVIGSANYDIGHVFSTGGGGVAGLGVVCWDGGKAWGVTGLSSPTGDPFYVDFVAHEMGHQFGGSHSFNGINGSCCCGNRNGRTAYEPGSGSTIQAYAGICGVDNLQAHSDPYFHSISFDEIRDYVTFGFGGTCPAITTTGNTPPTVAAGPDLTIPAATPFALTASGSDADGDALSYDWEERDLGPSASLSASDDGRIPLFRSLPPSVEPVRVFPRLADILTNSASDTEKLPTTNRTMTFRVTARDNRAGGGGVDWDERVLSVDASAGPFRVTDPAHPITSAGSLTVLWDVAGTDVAPVNVTSVDIELSVDGGSTFPIMLASNKANDGSETVTVPDLGGNTGRIKVEAVGNVFFSVSGSCLRPLSPTLAPDAKAKNRYLSLTPGGGGSNQAIRVTFTSLPAPFDVFDGLAMWVGPPALVSENGSSVEPIEGFPNFQAATLQCDPFFTDWGTIGPVHVWHRAIVPGGTYSVQMFDGVCGLADASAFSTPLTVTMSRWGDLAGAFDRQRNEWSAPDGTVDVTADIVAMLDTFTSRPGAPIKARADLEPATPDRLINITDVSRALDSFRGLAYPFTPGPVPCSG